MWYLLILILGVASYEFYYLVVYPYYIMKIFYEGQGMEIPMGFYPILGHKLSMMKSH
jgi:hypothetical protein